MANDHRDRYNALLSHTEANKKFRAQLVKAFPLPKPEDDLYALKMLLSELYPLFSAKGNAGKYAVWLIHAHCCLREGEKMVSVMNKDRSDIMEPTTRVEDLVQDNWDNVGEVLEHRRPIDDKVLSPPSADFWKDFRDIMNRRGIDSLGVCYASDPGKGYVFLEETGFQDEAGNSLRQHITKPTNLEDLVGKTELVATVWIPHACTPREVERFLQTPHDASDVIKFSKCSHICIPGQNHAFKVESVN